MHGVRGNHADYRRARDAVYSAIFTGPGRIGKIGPTERQIIKAHFSTLENGEQRRLANEIENLGFRGFSDQLRLLGIFT